MTEGCASSLVHATFDTIIWAVDYKMSSRFDSSPVVGRETILHWAVVHQEGMLATTESVLCTSVRLVPIQQIFNAFLF